MSNLGGMTDSQVFTVFGLALTLAAAFLADSYTTMIGLQHGMTEGNPLQRYLIKKLGTSLSTFLTGSAVLIGGAAMTNLGWAPSAAFFGVLAVTEIVQSILNYRKLKAAKISLK